MAARRQEDTESQTSCLVKGHTFAFFSVTLYSFLSYHLKVPNYSHSFFLNLKFSSGCLLFFYQNMVLIIMTLL